jgi:enoyl-CoA hydratase
MDNWTLTIDGLIATLAIDNANALNLLNKQSLDELGLCLRQIEDRDTKIVVMQGGGDRSFIGGADIREMNDMRPLEAALFSRRGQDLLQRIQRMGQIFIACVNGYALGAGCEVAMACDLRFASTSAKFGMPEVTLGIMPGFGGTYLLSRIVGPSRAKKMILLGEMIDASEAERIGLVHKMFEPDALKRKIREIAEEMSRLPTNSLASIKRVMNGILGADAQLALDCENAMFGACFSTREQKEGMLAFIEKRKPAFT